MPEGKGKLSYAGRDDLESLSDAGLKEAPDLVAPLVHAGMPLPAPTNSTTTVTATATATATATVTTTTSIPTKLAPAQQLQLWTQHQYAVPQVDQQHCLQVSQIATSPTIPRSITSPTYSSLDSPASENARLTGPFSPVYPLYDSELEEKISTRIDQIQRSTTIITTPPVSTQSSRKTQNILLLPPVETEISSASADPSQRNSNMFFGDLQKSSVTAHRRRSMATTSALTEYEADLTSKDRSKQKEAIRRMLAGKIREDWDWTWPKKAGEPGTPTDNRSQESLVIEDWREREEWISDVSESEDEIIGTVGSVAIIETANNKDPFRFDSPDGVGDTLRRTAEDRRARRRRRLEEEMRVNDGLSCFTHRRNAWTSARHVRRRPRASTTTTTTTPLKRTLSRPTSKPSPTVLTLPPPPPPAKPQEVDLPDLITEIRVAPPILPPDTPMRKGINERAYSTIYDKVVLQSQTPFCPINLSVMTKSCVEGWKRDGEWPPKSGGEMESVLAGVKKVSLGVDGGGVVKSKSMLRRSLQKVMGAVKERAGSKGKEGEEGVLRE